MFLVEGETFLAVHSPPLLSVGISTLLGKVSSRVEGAEFSDDVMFLSTYQLSGCQVLARGQLNERQADGQQWGGEMHDGAWRFTARDQGEAWTGILACSTRPTL